MALKSHFLPLDKPKIGVLYGRERDVSSGRQALGTRFLPLDSPKCDLCEVEEAMFQRLVSHFEFSVVLLTSQNATWLKSIRR